MILPAGKYYIGDPCYVLSEKNLHVAIDNMGTGGISEIDGHQMWAHFTQYGDGTFTDQNGVEYAVDGAALAAVPIDLIENPEGEEHGTVMEFANSFSVNYDDGVFWFGDICINTNHDVSDENVDDPLADGGYDGDPADDYFV